MDEPIEPLKGQRDALKKKLDAQNRWAIRPAALALVVLGFAIVVLIVLLTGGDSIDVKVNGLMTSGSSVSMLTVLAGITIMALGVLLYFLSPAKYLRTEVADALAQSGTTNIKKVLDSLLIVSQGVYLPAAQAGATRVFIPVAGDAGPAGVPKATGGVFVPPGTGAGGLMLEPPGYGLLTYSREIGASFTDEGLENEIKDALENSLELAGGVTVRREQGTFVVSMNSLANAGMCEAIRNDNPGTCTQIGCPVCSFVACMIAEGTGRLVRIESVKVKGRALNVTFRLV
ncbi:MAG TPA: hypothetical protein VGJ92_11940 [Methanocella sp.]|jgi:uncharacterized membrane protein YidH (DUF202 family)